jgi:methyltransferase
LAQASELSDHSAIAVVPLVLGLRLLALIFSLANAALLAYRVRVENESLVWAARVPRGPEALTASTLANGYSRR